MQSEFHFQKIWVVPSHFPPQKTPLANFEQRLRWCREIFNAKPFEVSDLEKNSSQTVFGIEIFSRLSLQNPEALYFWILGEDQWKQLSFWKNIDSYGRQLEWIVLPRSKQNTLQSKKGILSRRLAKSSLGYQVAQIKVRDSISSSEIRLALGKKNAKSKAKDEIFQWIPKSIQTEVLETYQPLTKGDLH